MPKRKKKDHDFAVNAFRVVLEATKDETPEPPPVPHPGKNPHAVALGRAGGKKGGPARAARLTPEERKAIAKKAAAARWKKNKP